MHRATKKMKYALEKKAKALEAERAAAERAKAARAGVSFFPFPFPRSLPISLSSRAMTLFFSAFLLRAHTRAEAERRERVAKQLAKAAEEASKAKKARVPATNKPALATDRFSKT